MTAYSLAFGGLLLLGGRAGDLLGRRRVFVAGLVLFTVASLLGGLAQAAVALLVCRAVQGVGAPRVPDGAVADRDDVPGRPAPQPGDGRLRRDGRRRRRRSG